MRWRVTFEITTAGGTYAASTTVGARCRQKAIAAVRRTNTTPGIVFRLIDAVRVTRPERSGMPARRRAAFLGAAL